MGEMAQRRRSLPRLLHRAHSDRGDAARHGRRRRVRVPGISPPAAGTLPARAGKARARLICRRRSRPRSITISPTGSAASMSNTCTRPTRKAWIRYPPPRWIWRGTAICGVPGEVSRAMLRGWHANNGVALGNLKTRLRLHQAERRRPGRPRRLLSSNTIIRSSSISGWCSRAISRRRCSIRPTAPALPVASWPRPRLEKAYRNYAMEYVRTAAPVMVQVFGPEDAALSAASHRQADRHAVFRRDRASFGVGRGGREGVRGVPARAVRSAGRCRRDQRVAAARSKSASRPGS